MVQWYLALLSALMCWTATAQIGSPDSLFPTDPLTLDGIPGEVHALLHQEFGKLVVAGDFDAVGTSSAGRIVRLLPDGSMDSTFNPGFGANDSIRCMVAVDNGKLLIGGDFTEFNSIPRARIARLHPDGSLDTTFDPGSGFNGTIHSLTTTFQSTNSYYVGGSFTEFDGEIRMNFAKVDRSGGLVDRFTLQTNGTVHIVYSSSSLPGRLNDLIIGGEFTEVGGQTRNRLAGLRSSGTLTSLNANPAGGPNGPILAVEEVDRYELLVGGAFSSWDGQARGNLASIIGSRDAVLSLQPLPSTNGTVRAILGNVSGLVVVGGDFTLIDQQPKSHLAALFRTPNNGDGWELSNSFGSVSDGTIVTLARSVEGKVALGGSFGELDGTSHTGLARLLGPQGLALPVQPEGFLAEAISSDGAIMLWERRRDVIGYRIEIRKEGGTSWDVATLLPFGPSAVLSGLAAGHQYDLRVIALGSNGDSLPSQAIGIHTDEIPWEGPGSPDPMIPSVDSGVLDTMVLRSDDSIIATGAFTRPNEPYGLVRYLPSGAKDLSFDVGTISPISSGRTLAALADGSIYLGGGFTQVGGLERDSVARIGPDALVDPNFAPPLGLIGEPNALGVQRDGKILVVETFPSGSGSSIIRLFPDGRIDESFDARSERVVGLRVLPDDRLIAWGSSMTIGGEKALDVALVSRDGLLDSSFNPLNSTESVAEVMALSSGRWLVVGGEEIVRLLPNGDPDETFVLTGSPDHHAFSNALFESAIEQPDGKLLIGGSFDSIGGQILPGIARLLPDGSLDEGFRPGSGFLGSLVDIDRFTSAIPREILLLPDQRIVVAGQFNSYNRSDHKALAFITGDAAPITPPEVPVLTATLAGEGATEIRWETVPGVFNYRLESSFDGLTNWTLCSVEGHATTRVVLPFSDSTPIFYRLVARNAAGIAESSPVEASANNSYLAWKLGFKIASEEKDDSDSDSDGRSLIVEYAVGTDPNVPDFSPWPRIIDATNVIGVAFPILREDLDLSVEATHNLIDWSDEIVTEERSTELIGTIPEELGKRYFFQVVVTPRTEDG